MDISHKTNRKQTRNKKKRELIEMIIAATKVESKPTNKQTNYRELQDSITSFTHTHTRFCQNYNSLVTGRSSPPPVCFSNAHTI